MAAAIRLTRAGTKKRPYYKLVVADARACRDGKFIEKLGTYSPLLPKNDPRRVTLRLDRIKHWLTAGAIPSKTVVRFLNAAKESQDNAHVKEINAKRVKVIELKRNELAEKKKAEAAAVKEAEKQAAEAASAAPAEDKPAA